MGQTASTDKARPVSMKDVRIQDDFWNYYIDLVRDVVVPYQWEAINDRVEGAERSGAVSNFKIAAGLAEGEFYGFVFQDTDVAKWLEAVAYLLVSKRDAALEQVADEMIDIIGKAQQPNGYLNTYFTIKEPEGKWTNLTECHELYTAGHMIEAGVAYYKATGKRKLLDIVSRAADNIAEVFGDGPGQIAGYDGHQEIELALVKLYEATGERRYLELSRYFIDKRGQQPSFFVEEAERRGWTTHWRKNKIHIDHAYFQAHQPVREQEAAAGHAVRVVYMLAGMADVARETGDETLLEACRRLWDNIANKQMYVTGGIGSMAQGEAFSFDYDLPNDTIYSETCAAIGLIFFAHRMLQLEPNSRYADVMERALYNTVLGGMSRDGRHFFYVNPLEVTPGVCEGRNKNFNHVKPVRQEWFGCACCPPNIARLLASLGEYVYSVKGDTVYAHLYIGGEAELAVGGAKLRLKQEAGVPWEGKARFEVSLAQPSSFALALRVPDWAAGAEVLVNGAAYPIDGRVRDGYAVIDREWADGDVAELALEMPVMRVRSHPLVKGNASKVALQRGPLVYCVEEADNGPQLQQLMLPLDAKLEVGFDAELAGGLKLITAEALRLELPQWGSQLYRTDSGASLKPAVATFIPYYAWANRGKGEMAVWVKERV
ncbi:glycoside hydrolase family 127 protein [Paenibacillus arenilitoris]|uniref:Glycoside hydrolase family 127 protein n=1 Tax=Paenibacillus arenilitoris TaxID=2772299 RepID=A0A927CK26_9BACL|nr:beta-L-arabinofuranosidase domain-containing protein [Paenibacillus arenilitoris]MBD2867636.1 glycoside hydrolase family 127 protein [Paenibacillus arenilitoris]